MSSCTVGLTESLWGFVGPGGRSWERGIALDGGCLSSLARQGQTYCCYSLRKYMGDLKVWLAAECDLKMAGRRKIMRKLNGDPMSFILCDRSITDLSDGAIRYPHECHAFQARLWSRKECEVPRSDELRPYDLVAGSVSSRAPDGLERTDIRPQESRQRGSVPLACIGIAQHHESPSMDPKNLWMTFRRFLREINKVPSFV